jgi:hypothetical protein
VTGELVPCFYPSMRRERLHPPFGLLPKCSTGKWDLVKCVSGTDTRSMYSRNRRRANHWVAHRPSEIVLRSLSPSGMSIQKRPYADDRGFHVPC